MIEPILMHGALFLLTYITAILLHEHTHVYIARYLGYKAGMVLRLKKPSRFFTYVKGNVTPKHNNLIILAGVFVGVAFILFIVGIIDPQYTFTATLTLFPYFMGCKSDFKQLVRVSNESSNIRTG